MGGCQEGNGRRIYKEREVGVREKRVEGVWSSEDSDPDTEIYTKKKKDLKSWAKKKWQYKPKAVK